MLRAEFLTGWAIYDMLSYAILEKIEVLITGVHHCMKTWESPKDWTCLDEKTQSVIGWVILYGCRDHTCS